MKNFYLQVNQDGLITDAIDYQYEDYVEVQVSSLPVGVNGGWFKLENGVIVEHLELKPVSPEDEITQIKNTQAQVVLSLVMGGLM